VLFHSRPPLLMFRTLSFIVFACASTVASAATLQQLSMPQMAQSATAVVRAHVTGSYASFTGSTIYTHYKLQISETWKGSPGSEVMLPGGVANGLRQSFPGVPQLQTGAEYVLFLWTSSTTGITHVIGLNQGIFSLSQQSDGTMQANRARIGEGIYDSSGHAVQDHGMQMNLADMQTLVRQNITTATVK
jgi:hypothetical protein